MHEAKGKKLANSSVVCASTDESDLLQLGNDSREVVCDSPIDISTQRWEQSQLLRPKSEIVHWDLSYLFHRLLVLIHRIFPAVEKQVPCKMV